MGIMDGILKLLKIFGGAKTAEAAKAPEVVAQAPIVAAKPISSPSQAPAAGVGITVASLVAMGVKQSVAEAYCGPLNEACAKFKIDTNVLLCAFFAQILVESGALSRSRENMNYSAERAAVIFHRIFASPAAAKAYEGQPEKLANLVYAKANGNNQPGDGWKYRGAGPIQLTGRGNYAAFAAFTGIDVVASPELLETPRVGALCAAWFFAEYKKCRWAAQGDNEAAVEAVTKLVNGGQNGIKERKQCWREAKIALHHIK